MGNLIRDFWVYTYKDKDWYGIVEVIRGENLGQSRNTKKYETHIEKALDYTLNNNVVSHMSIQTYYTWLNDRSGRELHEQKYYPFVLEFEDKNYEKNQGKNYTDVVYEVAAYVNHLINVYNVNKDDILVMINNSKSIYVFVNPKVYLPKPDKDLHLIYLEMYRKIKAELGFKYVDESIVASSYKLMKTPNCYYNGGYFVAIELEELMQLLTGVVTKEQLTARKRSLNKEVPAQLSLNFIRLYNAAVKKIKGKDQYKNEPAKGTECMGSCVKYFMQHLIEKGYRNYALVSVAIYLKGIGYTEKEVLENLIELANAWNHDESIKKIESKVRAVFRNKYRFSCGYAKAVFEELGVENLCANCPYKNKRGAKGFNFDAEIINELWENNASTRHYVMYLELEEKQLLNKCFDPKLYGLNERTLRELCNFTKAFKREKKDGQVYIEYIPSKKLYTLPEGFISESVNALGEYIKHYLKAFIKGYKALDKYVLIRISKVRLMQELGYKEESGFYKFLKRLIDLGFIKEHSNSVFSIYYETYKVISIEQPKDNTEVITEDEVLAAVAGEQLALPHAEAGSRIIFKSTHFRRSNSKKIERGSPG